MELTNRERQSGLLVAVCKCCGNTYRAHEASNACAYSPIPNFGCIECKGVNKDSGKLPVNT